MSLQRKSKMDRTVTLLRRQTWRKVIPWWPIPLRTTLEVERQWVGMR